MANHNQNAGRNAALPDDNRPNWRPQDQPSSQGERGHYGSWRDRNYRDDERHAAGRDPRRWEGSRGSELGHADDRDTGGRSTERYGQGQSGYSAGRYGDDRSQQMQNRNEMFPSAGGLEDRYHEMGGDDRFTGRGRPTYWQDQGGHELGRPGPGRSFDAERLGIAHGGWRSYDEAMGYGQGDPSVGHAQRGARDDAWRHTALDAHVHRGTGPHRGKGPVGYQRSDERIRELICESLADDDQLDASRIEVAVKDGDVTLSGNVEGRHAKRHAEDCAWSVSGVRELQNSLRVTDDRRSITSGSFAAGTEALPSDKKHRA